MTTMPSLATEFTETIQMGRHLLAAWKQRYEASQRARAQVQEESRVRGECLELAMKALGLYSASANSPARRALNNIRERLAQLEPEEETR